VLSSPSQWPEGQVRIAFDGDGVLFSDEAERIAKSQGLQAFYQFEKDRGYIALPKGPMQAFALKLQKVRQSLGEDNQWRVRTFLVTARNDVANLRVFHTLKEWSLDIDETHFLGGLDKTPFLRAIDPAIFFDDSSEHIDRAKLHILSAHVVYGINSIQTTVPSDIPTIKLPLENENEEQNIDEVKISQ
jgi:5'-nucleotidase